MGIGLIRGVSVHPVSLARIHRSQFKRNAIRERHLKSQDRVFSVRCSVFREERKQQHTAIRLLSRTLNTEHSATMKLCEAWHFRLNSYT